MAQPLTILHDNDIHGHLRDFCYIEIAKGPVEHCGIGGAARRASLVRSLKARAGAPVLLIDSGDTTTRGPLTTQYEGVDEIAITASLNQGPRRVVVGHRPRAVASRLGRPDAEKA